MALDHRLISKGRWEGCVLVLVDCEVIESFIHLISYSLVLLPFVNQFICKMCQKQVNKGWGSMRIVWTGILFTVAELLEHSETMYSITNGHRRRIYYCTFTHIPREIKNCAVKKFGVKLEKKKNADNVFVFWLLKQNRFAKKKKCVVQ